MSMIPRPWSLHWEPPPRLVWYQWWLWTVSTGCALYSAWRLDALQPIVTADETGLSVLLLLFYVGSSIYAGRRSHWLAAQSVSALRDCPPEQQRERMKGPHEGLWFMSAVALRLGLLGTVIGFIAMLMSLQSLPATITDMAPQLIEDMSRGMAIALNTTLIGLLVSLGLAAQTLLLDRAADSLLARVAGEAA